MNFVLETTCVEAIGEDIQEMQDKSTDITRRTFRKHVDIYNLEGVEKSLGYFLNAKQGMTMASDWHVSYHKSMYQGRPCYYFSHSCIEHVFVDTESKPLSAEFRSALQILIDRMNEDKLSNSMQASVNRLDKFILQTEDIARVMLYLEEQGEEENLWDEINELEIYLDAC